MKNVKLTLKLCAALGLISLVGCAHFTPGMATATTATIVSIGLINSPNTATNLAAAQPFLCDLVTSKNPSPDDVAGAVRGLESIVGNRWALAIVNSVGLYAAATDAQQGGNTNATVRAEYAKAIWCDGLAMGLAMVPQRTAMRNAPMAGWPIIR